MPPTIPDILLVEADMTHAKLIRQAFAASMDPMTLHHVPSLGEARAFLAQSAPDLVLTAYELPDGSGSDLLPADRENALYPVFILAGHGHEKLAAQIMKTGASDFVIKSEALFADLPLLATAALRDWHNIVERRKAVKALKDSEASYRTLAQNLPGIVYRVHLAENNRSQYFNRMLEQITGFKESELQDTQICSMPALIFPEDKTRVAGRLQHAIDQAVSFELEYRIRDKHDKIKYCHELGRVVKNRDGRPVYIDGVIFDVTEAKETQAALEVSRQAWQSIVDNAIVGIYRVTAGGRILMANPSMARMFGYDSTAKLLAKVVNFADLYQEPAERLALMHKIDTTGFINGVEIRMRRRDGRPMWVRANVRQVDDPNGRKVYEGFLVDISEQKALMHRVQQSQKLEAIGTLAGGIAHDFNNMLAPLLGFAEMLKEDLSGDSHLHEYTDEIINAALRSRDLVQQILTFSRQVDSKVRPVKLQPIIKEAIKLLRSSIPATIKIQQQIASDCGIVNADPTQIHQIIMNLATNAYHAMEATGGWLKVTLKQIRLEADEMLMSEMSPGAYARLRITDTGDGIEKQILDRIFDPYFSTKSKGKGTGLGLSVVQGIVKSCNGDIRVDSEIGKGTVADVYLPILEHKTEQQVVEVAEPVIGGVERILLVDDEAPILRLEQQMLERLGYQVTTRTGSLEALAAFKAVPEKYDLILTDLTMPNMTGIQLVDEIRKIRPTIPVVICTGFSELIDEEKSKAIGIQGLVLKPVVKRHMAKTIRSALDQAADN